MPPCLMVLSESDDLKADVAQVAEVAVCFV